MNTGTRCRTSNGLQKHQGIKKTSMYRAQNFSRTYRIQTVNKLWKILEILLYGVTFFDHIYYCHRQSLYITHTEHTSSLNVLNISTNKHELVYNYLSSSDNDSCCNSTCFRKCPSKVCWWCVKFCVNCTAAEFKTATTPAWAVWRSGILLYLSSSFTLINLSSTMPAGIKTRHKNT